MTEVKAIPDGYSTVTPHLLVSDAEKCIAFYKKAFSAKELGRQTSPDGKLILHCDLKIGDSIVMLSNALQGEESDGDWVTPKKAGGTTVVLHLFVANVDDLYQQALVAGCKSKMRPINSYWGDRYSQVLDPFGYLWSIATRQKNLSEAEINKASKQYFAKQAAKNL